MWKKLCGREPAGISATSAILDVCGSRDGLVVWSAMGPNACARCGGLMVASYFNGIQGNLADELLPCWRCLNCGDLVDTQVLVNRLARRRQLSR